MSKKIVITGASGKIAEATYKYLSNETDYQIILFTSGSAYIDHRKTDKVYTFDIRNKKTLDFIIEDERPDVIINTAAMTDVDACEDDKKNAWLLNSTLVENLASLSKKYKIHLITFSTDYIFDGKDGPYDEDALPNPISYYGKSKLAGENLARTQCDKSTVIRTNVVYGYSSYGKNDFIRWLIKNLEEGKKLNIIDGQYCNPTYSEDIAHGVYKAISKKEYGVYNFSGEGYYKRYEIAMKVCEVYNFDKKLVNSIPSKELKQKAKRPEKGGLINLKAKSALGIKFTTLENGLTNLKLKLYGSKRHEANL